jgi:hypothetical protein
MNEQQEWAEQRYSSLASKHATQASEVHATSFPHCEIHAFIWSPFSYHRTTTSTEAQIALKWPSL